VSGELGERYRVGVVADDVVLPSSARQAISRHA
jgi:hypothetical protein